MDYYPAVFCRPQLRAIDRYAIYMVRCQYVITIKSKKEYVFNLLEPVPEEIRAPRALDRVLSIARVRQLRAGRFIWPIADKLLPFRLR
jgi:hypothetical protein